MWRKGLVENQWRSKGRGQAGAHQHTFCNHLKTRFKQKPRIQISPATTSLTT